MTIYQDYGYGSSYDAITTGFGILTGFFVYFIVMLVVALAVSVVVCIALWKIFKRFAAWQCKRLRAIHSSFSP